MNSNLKLIYIFHLNHKLRGEILQVFTHLSQVEGQPGDLRPPEGHAKVVEDELRHLDFQIFEFDNRNEK